MARKIITETNKRQEKPAGELTSEDHSFFVESAGANYYENSNCPFLQDGEIRKRKLREM